MAIIGEKDKVTVNFVSAVKGLRIVKYHDASLGILEANLLDVCRDCGLCAGIKAIPSTGKVATYEPNGLIPQEVLDHDDCELVGHRTYVNMDHVETRRSS